MADNELQLSAISKVPGLVDLWREQEEALLSKHQAELDKLRQERKVQETTLSAGVLQTVCDMCESGLNERFERLDDLFNGFSVTEENHDLTWNLPRTDPLVPIESFYYVAHALAGTGAGKFMKSLITDFQKSSCGIPKDQIRVIGISGSQNPGERISGLVMLCDNNVGAGHNNHISVGFDVFFKGKEQLPDVVVRSAQFLEEDYGRQPRTGSLNEQFEYMLLSEQVSVIAALFVATDRAVTAALQERQAPINKLQGI